jgi:hypothetical protein
MNATLLQKIELRFWDIFLPLLSQSEFLRKTVKTAGNLYRNKQLRKQIAFAAMIACAGFASGILVYTITRFVG